MGPNAKLTRAFPSLCSYTDLHTHQKDCFSLAQKVWDTRLGVGNKGWKRSRMRRWIVFFCRGIKFSKREKGICSTIPVFLGLPWNLSQTCTGNFCMKCGRHTQTHTNTHMHLYLYLYKSIYLYIYDMLWKFLMIASAEVLIIILEKHMTLEN